MFLVEPIKIFHHKNLTQLLSTYFCFYKTVNFSAKQSHVGWHLADFVWPLFRRQRTYESFWKNYARSMPLRVAMELELDGSELIAKIVRSLLASAVKS